eukprot:6397900-Prymnesium_polylepis.1
MGGGVRAKYAHHLREPSTPLKSERRATVSRLCGQRPMVWLRPVIATLPSSETAIDVPCPNEPSSAPGAQVVTPLPYSSLTSAVFSLVGLRSRQTTPSSPGTGRADRTVS